MKSAKVLVSAILIPTLLVASGGGASESVRKLLRKPRVGPARVTFGDGTQTQGTVRRVTTQFLSLDNADTCSSVELTQIASIKWFPSQGDSLGDTLELIAWVVIGSPFWVPWYIADALGNRVERDPLGFSWESTPTLPDGKISRIEGNGNGLMQRSVAVEKGRYDVIGKNLHLTYDASGLVETIPFQFDCDSLVLGDQKLSAQLSASPAQDPIVGRWLPRMDHSSFWEFTASGTFEKRSAESKTEGRIEKIKGGVRVKWLGPDAKPNEEWGIRTKGHHLLITAGGATTEYVRAD